MTSFRNAISKIAEPLTVWDVFPEPPDDFGLGIVALEDLKDSQTHRTEVLGVANQSTQREVPSMSVGIRVSIVETGLFIVSSVYKTI